MLDLSLQLFATCLHPVAVLNSSVILGTRACKLTQEHIPAHLHEHQREVFMSMASHLSQFCTCFVYNSDHYAKYQLQAQSKSSSASLQHLYLGNALLRAVQY